MSPCWSSPRSCFRLSQEIKGLCFVFCFIATFEMTVKKEIRSCFCQPVFFCLQSTYSARLTLREQRWRPRSTWTQLIYTPDKSTCTKLIPPWFIFRKTFRKEQCMEFKFNFNVIHSHLRSLSRVRRNIIRPYDVLQMLKQPVGRAREIARAADCMSNTLSILKRSLSRRQKRSINATGMLYFFIPRSFKLAQHNGCS